jgi:hypothetical protein
VGPAHPTDGPGRTEPRALADEVARLRDIDSIRRLTAAYNDAWDDGRGADWVAVFTPDGRFSMPDTPDVVGVDALREFADAQRDGGFVHTTTDHVVDVDGDTAVQTCRLILSNRSPSMEPGSAKWLTTGRYRDDLRRTPDGWRFTHRSFAPDSWWAS